MLVEARLLEEFTDWNYASECERHGTAMLRMKINNRSQNQAPHIGMPASASASVACMHARHAIRLCAHVHGCVHVCA